ncbi:hypothetical protein AGABI2DRAFT_136441 [Agaricus bisporus var. bisporus H97]|uniref:hypothetical protein n=1 Tax=Agaricus bisporus var. bisporus (strain H97 / ATCC MYA-4626 / FGSC 10389) TaxID=936046 RepID=UPI00029F60E8|nr:hypothetical protein AGABI2DRAFT_136441 [Agaricus bisporus var. bisporus H97]EKV47772.1 hypothetical protein AGABI2DRAFT_136441 [Agaricus bisporus var. bisporus H97]
MKLVFGLIIVPLLLFATTTLANSKGPKFRSGTAECHGCWAVEPFDCPEGWSIEKHKLCYTCCKPLGYS